MAYLNLQLLGGISVRLDSIGRVKPPSKKSAALLAYLASKPGNRRSRDELSALLWGSYGNSHARGSLRQTLKLLRKSLHHDEHTVICTDGEYVYLDPNRIATDAQLLDRISDAATPEALQQAATVYQGEFLAGFSLDERLFQAWLGDARRQYHDLVIAVLRRLQNHHLAGGTFKEALRIGDRLLKLDPTQEDIHRSQMNIFLDLGHRHRALQQYRICREILQAELDVRPEAATEELHARIRGDIPAGDTKTAPASGVPPANVSATHKTDWFSKNSKDLSMPELPSLAMLPFRDLSGGDSQQYYGEGLRYEIQAALIKVSALLLIAPASVNAYRNTSNSADRAARDLGVNYILEGSFHKQGGQIDATFQLTRTGPPRIIWAKPFRCEHERIGEMQNEVILGVLESLQIDVHAGEEARIFQHTLSQPAARELFYRGANLGYSGTKDGNARARAAFREVTRLQPDSPVGPTYLSFTYWLDVFKGWTKKPDGHLATGVTWARRALDLSDSNGLAYLVLAYDHLCRHRHSEALACGFKAVDFRPNCPTANGILAYVLLHSGRPTEAVEWITRAIKRSPTYPPWFVNVLAAAYRDAGDYEASIRAAKMSLEISPADIEARAILCSDFVLVGKRQRALRIGQEIVEILPAFSLEDYVSKKHYRDHDAASLIEDSLRDARLPA